MRASLTLMTSSRVQGDLPVWAANKTSHNLTQKLERELEYEREARQRAERDLKDTQASLASLRTSYSAALKQIESETQARKKAEGAVLAEKHGRANAVEAIAARETLLKDLAGVLHKAMGDVPNDPHSNI